MINEWEIITQTNRVPSLPSSLCIKSALDEYLEHKLKQLVGENKDLSNNSKTMNAIEKAKKRKEFEDMVEGIGKYFDEMLPQCLLYRQEIPQYKAMKTKSRFKCMRYCEIYGCEYLLRLFVRLPALLEEQNQYESKMEQKHVDEKELKRVYAMIGDLVRYLQNRQFYLFKLTYRKPKDDELMLENDGTVKEIKLKVNINESNVAPTNKNSNANATNVNSNTVVGSSSKTISKMKNEKQDTSKSNTGHKPKLSIQRRTRSYKHKISSGARR